MGQQLTQLVIKDILANLEAISQNRNNEPLHVLGGYIVGATIVRDDIEELYRSYPQFEIIAELGADLETLQDDALAKPVFEEFRQRLHEFATQLQ